MMKKRTIVEAIVEVLRAEGKSMTAAEVYDTIIGAGLYTFNTDTPVHIVRTQIRRHCAGLDFPSASKTKYFQVLSNGRYDLLPDSGVNLLAQEPITDKSSVTNHSLKSLHQKYLAEFTRRTVEQIKTLEPDAFERFCRNLLDAYGFREATVTRVSKDGGIDGHGKLKVGFVYFNVAFQCKRYTRGNVGRPEIDQFRGAIQGEYEQGIFFTTSDFTSEAQNASLKAGAVPVILINGVTIVEVMVEKAFGIETEYLPLHSLALDLAISDED